METLTTQQAKQVIEYFAQQAAEDAPELPLAFDKHLWMTRFQVSLAIERQITEADWNELVDVMTSWQSFDRDPKGFMYEHGEADWGTAIDLMQDTLQDQVSWWIDTAYSNAGA